jgi:hypothetical protein
MVEVRCYGCIRTETQDATSTLPANARINSKVTSLSNAPSLRRPYRSLGDPSVAGEPMMGGLWAISPSIGGRPWHLTPP